MKCPNCNKEALFVNGKYVCVDCGIEITPDEAAAQTTDSNLANSLSTDNAELKDQGPIVPNPVASDVSANNDTNNIQSDPPEEVAPPIAPSPEAPQDSGPALDATPSTTPVDMAASTTQQEATGNGVYDFDQNASVGGNDSSEAVTEVPAGSTGAVTTPEIAPQDSPAQEPSYFNPASHDIKATQTDPSAPEAAPQPQPTESEHTKNFDAYSTPAGIGSGEPVVGDLSSPASEPPAPTPDLAANSEPIPTVQPESNESVQEFSPINNEVTPAEAAPAEAPASMAPNVSQPQPESAGPQEPSPGVADANFNTETAPNINNTVSQSLDEMLDQAAPAAPSPASAYGGGSVDNMKPAVPADPNASQAGAAAEDIPPVSEVFGNNNQLPTAQDFGVPPKQEPPKDNRKLYMIIAGVVGGLLILAGIVIGLVAFLGRDSGEPVVLSESEVAALSSSVAAAMEPDQSISTDFEFSVNYANLTAVTEADLETDDTDEAQEAAPVEETLTTDAMSGLWQTDEDGDIYLQSISGEVNTKKTYIESLESTYVFNEDKEDWANEEGLLINEVPDFFGPKNKAATFLNPNIASMTSLGEETIGDAEYTKYEIVPTEELAQASLSTMSSTFSEAVFSNFGASELRITAWLTSDYKIYQLVVSGDVSLVTPEYEGSVNISANALYNYDAVVITDPTEDLEASAGAEETDQLPDNEVAASGQEEEVEPEVVVEEEPVVIEPKVESPASAKDDELIDARG